VFAARRTVDDQDARRLVRIIMASPSGEHSLDGGEPVDCNLIFWIGKAGPRLAVTRLARMGVGIRGGSNDRVELAREGAKTGSAKRLR
jgi:hypothetical protein